MSYYATTFCSGSKYEPIKEKWEDRVKSKCKNAIVKINSDEEKKIKTIPVNSELIVTLGKSGAKWNDKLFAAPHVDVFDVISNLPIIFVIFEYFFVFECHGSLFSAF